MEFGVRETFKAFKTTAWYNVDTHFSRSSSSKDGNGRWKNGPKTVNAIDIDI